MGGDVSGFVVFSDRGGFCGSCVEGSVGGDGGGGVGVGSGND